MPSRMQQIVTAFETAFSVPKVQILKGRKAVDEQGRPPRLVFVRTGGTTSVGGNIGGKMVGTAKRVNQLFTLGEDIEMHIWGETEELTENLHEAALRVLHECFGPDMVTGAYAWQTEDDDKAGHEFSSYGKIVQQLVWNVPATDEDKTLTTVVSHTHTPNLQPGPF